MYTRGIWIFALSADREEAVGETIRLWLARHGLGDMSEYLLALGGGRYALISKLFDAQLEEDGWNGRVQQTETTICGLKEQGYRYQLLFLSDQTEAYLEKLELLWQRCAKDIEVYFLHPHLTLLLCDLGDVVWEECGAKEHMWEVARTSLKRCGYDVGDRKWRQTYRRMAETTSGERFYRCVEELSDPDTASLVRKAVTDDFREMSDRRYLHCHPLRSDFYREFYRLQGSCNICFIANQPRKTYTLLREYKVGLITPLWFLSCDHGLKKPDPQLFSECLRHLKNAAFKRCYMCGNRKDMDLIPAQKTGIEGILYLCGRSALKEETLHREYMPKACVRNFRELYQWIKEEEEDEDV